MKRCCKCERFGIVFDSAIDKERCVWRDCLWVNETNINIDLYFEMKIAIHGTKYKKFAEALEKK